MKLEWSARSLDDRDAIMRYIARDDPRAAIELDIDFATHALSRPGAPRRL